MPAAYKFHRSDRKAYVTIDSSGLSWAWHGGGFKHSHTATPKGAHLAMHRHSQPGTYWPDLPPFDMEEASLPGLSSKTSRALNAPITGTDVITALGFRHPQRRPHRYVPDAPLEDAIDESLAPQQQRSPQ